jgi:hypothetical protein
MGTLVKLISDISLLLYAFFGLLIILFMRGVIVSRSERDRSIFSLEREAAISRMYRYYLGAVIMIGLMGVVYYNSTSLVNNVPLPEVTPSPTTIVELPPTATPVILLSTPTPTPTIPAIKPPMATVTYPTATPPPAPQTKPARCSYPGSQITLPEEGANVNGMVQISGSAFVDNFDYYKFEFRVPGGNWSFIASYRNQVQSGVLGSWNSDTVPPGEYQLRLVVVDKIGNFPEPCMVNLQAHQAK